nr:hypothetical protein CFP56_09556 [Quercus suber]
MNGEDTMIFCGPDGPDLLRQEEAQDHKRYDEEGDDLPGIPGVDGATKGDGHDDGDVAAAHQHHSDVVDLHRALFDRLPGPRVERWEKEDVDRGADTANNKIATLVWSRQSFPEKFESNHLQIKRPAPVDQNKFAIATRAGLTHMPAPPTPQMARPTINASIDGAAPQTAEPTANMTNATQNISPSRSYEEGHRKPRQLVEGIELVDDGWLDVRNNGVVQSEEKIGRKHREDSQRPSDAVHASGRSRRSGHLALILLDIASGLFSTVLLEADVAGLGRVLALGFLWFAMVLSHVTDVVMSVGSGEVDVSAQVSLCRTTPHSYVKGGTRMEEER